MSKNIISNINMIFQILFQSILGCNFGGFLGTVAALSEIWSLSVVSLDRFRYIHYPLQYEKKITKSQVL